MILAFICMLTGYDGLFSHGPGLGDVLVRLKDSMVIKGLGGQLLMNNGPIFGSSLLQISG